MTDTEHKQDSKFLDTKQAANYLGCSDYTLRRWRHDGEGKGPKYFKIHGRMVRYRPQDLDAFATKEARQ